MGGEGEVVCANFYADGSKRRRQIARGINIEVMGRETPLKRWI